MHIDIYLIQLGTFQVQNECAQTLCAASFSQDIYRTCALYQGRRISKYEGESKIICNVGKLVTLLVGHDAIRVVYLSPTVVVQM
jgi:hypothetical protein